LPEKCDSHQLKKRIGDAVQTVDAGTTMNPQIAATADSPGH
jgi:hypothetical protein